MARRRQETLWIHRWSRRLIAGIAALGVLETSYLSWSKLTGSPVACPVEGCDRVLDSAYATLFGVPIALFGLLAYATMLLLAVLPLVTAAEKSDRRQQLEGRTWPLMFILALVMAICSGYLMYLMFFVLKATCPYCLTSALFAFSFLGLTLVGHRWEDRGQMLLTGLITGMVTITAVLALYAPIQATTNANASSAGGQAGPPVTTPSSAAEIALAQHLKSVGAKMYGAWWCPHCYDQKALFGAEATTELPYVECAEDGKNPQTDLCRSKSEVTGFPTWEINGKFYAGTQTLEQLAELSGYTGAKNFKPGG